MGMALCFFIFCVCVTLSSHAALAGKLSADSTEGGHKAADDGPEMTLIVTPAEQPVVRGVGETLTLTCTLLPLSPAPANSSDNTTTSADDAVQEMMRRAAQHQETLKKQKDLAMAQELHWEEDPPSLHWVVPINDVSRVSEEPLGSGDLAGMTSRRVLVHRLQEADAGNYTCEVPQLQRRAVVQLHVLHRDVVQRCGVSSFQCSTGECILLRFVCDNKPDCPHATDELSEHCGFGDVCRNKLRCDDGRCMEPSRCCRGPPTPQSTLQSSPLNCSVNPSIQCCRQLIHPAALDQDLFYLSTRPRPHVRPSFFAQPSPLLIGTLVAVANICAVCLVLTLRRRFWPPASPSLTLSPLTWWRHTSREALGVVGGPSPHSWGRWSRPGGFPRTPRHRCSGPHSVSFSAFAQVTSSLSDDAPARPTHSSVPYTMPPPSYQEAVCGPPPPYYSPGLHRSARVREEECVPLHVSARLPRVDPASAGHCRCPVPSVAHSSSSFSTTPAASEYVFAIPVSVVRPGFTTSSHGESSNSVPGTSQTLAGGEPRMLADESVPDAKTTAHRVTGLPPSGARMAVRSASSATAGRRKVPIKRRRVVRTGSDGGTSNPLLSEAVVVRASQLPRELGMPAQENSLASSSVLAQLPTPTSNSDAKELCISHTHAENSKVLKPANESRTAQCESVLPCSQAVTAADDEHSTLNSSSSSSCLAISSDSRASSLSSAASSLSF